MTATPPPKTAVGRSAGWSRAGSAWTSPPHANRPVANGQQDLGEACDDGNIVDDDGCSPSCAVEEGWECYGFPSNCQSFCGDGVVVGSEECDDGNTSNGDGCDEYCAVESGWTCTGEPSLCSSVCGDGIVAEGEGCDDGNTLPGDGCSDSCEVEPHWECSGDGPSDCKPVCGDGLILGNESCDDGNSQPGDGCSDSCSVEDFNACHGEPSSCTCVVFVDIDPVPSPRTGVSWTAALDDPNEAVYVAEALTPCEVWVAEGTYHLYDSSPHDALELRSGVALCGGFTGVETQRSARDAESHVTILDGSSSNTEDTCYTAVEAINIQNALLDGFTIQNGGSVGSSTGGGLEINGSTQITLSNCTFSNNTARNGGGAFFSGSDVLVTDCVFQENLAIQNGDNTGDGGGVLVDGGQTVFQDTLFIMNDAGDDGGGLFIFDGGPHEVIGCRFLSNVSGDMGGGARFEQNTVDLIDGRLSENTANRGAGVHLVDGTFHVVNTIFHHNDGTYTGAVNQVSGAQSTFWNCVFYGNLGGMGITNGAAIGGSGVDDAVVYNSVFWAHVDDLFPTVGSEPIISYSIVEGGFSDNDNSDASPMFVDPENGDFHLQPDSACIDSALGTGAPEHDYDGNPRADDPNVTNTGSGTPDYADRGAFEYQP